MGGTNGANLSALDRRGTERLYGAKNGDRAKLGDYNGDGRADLLCHDLENGYKFIDYANASGQFQGGDWASAAAFCNHFSGRLFKGDFNGDGRQDLLCHDIGNGWKWIDYADTNGQLAGADWSTSTPFCNSSSGRLFVGDFNGDGRDDLLCHDIVGGGHSVWYTGASGQLGASTWSRPSAGCNSPDTRIMVGDFNGDGRDDLLCTGLDNGYRWIDYADSAGQFNSFNDFTTALGWCSHPGAELHIGDFNGDGRDDLLCHDTVSGNLFIDYASATGTFAWHDWSRVGAGCNHRTARLFIGDVNGDGRDDLVCHDVQGGQKWVDLADVNGQFSGWEWSVALNWCDIPSSELH
ncbi:MAG: VCBS repeat-containing protein [Labilithrix sp.]|nr:VCBS repeat-containing protein [Labilithrix sp.]MCW5810316.1 VCBS repeat-containing protein [Labilithrix sp.]